MGDNGQRVIRLVLLCNRRLEREALAAYFAGQAGFTVLGHTATAECLQQLCAVTRPDAALVEVEQLDQATVQALYRIRREHPRLHVVVIYTSLPSHLITDAVRHDIVSFVPATSGLDTIAGMLRCRAHRGTAGRGERGALDRGAVGNGRRLTTRELAVVSLMSSGHTTAGIAGLLRISPHTVDNHKRRIYAKLGVGSHSLAVAHAISLGIVPAPATGGVSTGRAAVPHLTGREQDVLAHIVQGHTTRQAARALGIAAKTVENTQTRLYRKLGTHSRSETLSVAYRLGLVDVRP